MKPPPSQTALILNRLRKSRGWVSMTELVAISGSYNIHSRIDNIRHTLGIAVENRLQRTPGTRSINSQYRLAR